MWTKSLGTTLSPNELFTNDESFRDVIPTKDGGAVVGYTFRTPQNGTSGYEYGRLDANGNQVWYKRLNNQYDLEPKTAIGNCGFLFTGTKNSNLTLMRITNDGEILPNCGGAIAAPATAQMQVQAVLPQLSPNPADKEVTIALESLDDEIVQFDFSSTTGSLVFSEKRRVDKGANRLLFEVAQLPKGIYWVTPTTNQGRMAPMKFVKL
ncbi:MAG: Secretion system C-terminal sorting domain [Bacteroidota bacterium]